MNTKCFGRVLLVAAAVGSLPLTVFADEVVHFTNGAEMTVRSHTVEKAKDMVKLDLGGNSFIAFPMSMVDKIVSSGQDVFLNPVFHPANQAIAGGAGSMVADTGTRGIGEPQTYPRKPGVALGEAAGEAPPIPAGFGQLEQQSVANSRKAFNPASPSAPGAPPQVIMPPGKGIKPAQFAMIPTRPPVQPAAPPPPTTPPASSDPPDSTPPPSDPPEDPPDTP